MRSFSEMTHPKTPSTILCADMFPPAFVRSSRSRCDGREIGFSASSGRSQCEGYGVCSEHLESTHEAMIVSPNKITAPNAGGSRQFPTRTV
jgi:hypothetical protein